MKNNEIFVIVLLMATVVMTAASLSYFKNDLVNKNLQLQELIEEQNRKIAYFEKEMTYEIETLKESIFEVEEKIEDAELKLNSHTGLLNKIGLWQTEHEKKHKQKQSSARTSKKVPVNLSKKDIRNIAALTYLEAGSQSYRCQKAVVSVVINRMIKYKKTATQIIYQPGVFSVAYKVAKTKPSAQSLKATCDVIKNGTTLPRSVVAFRNGRYHSFGRRYCCIDGVYFSSMR